jgi:hypothetical protein
MLDFVFEAGLRVFKWLLDAFAARIVLPAMIGSPDAIRLDESVIERGAAVGAVLADETIVSALIAEQHQILPQDF